MVDIYGLKFVSAGSLLGDLGGNEDEFRIASCLVWPLALKYLVVESTQEAYKNTKTSADGLQSCLINWLNALEGYIDLHLSLISNEASNKLLQSGMVKITSASMIELHHRRLDFGEVIFFQRVSHEA